MIWYLLICGSVSGYSSGGICQPPALMPSKAVCEFVAQNYREIGYAKATRVRCVGVRK